jgi:beta-lactamase superfamily II metal-dependent hydrolase
MEFHFIDVGCGNMTLLLFPEGTTYLYDCNVTEDNEDAVLAYLSKAMSDRYEIDVFVCSHRDADHMRGIKKIHAEYPIKLIRDPGIEGTTTDSTEYREYMALRRQVGSTEIAPRTRQEVDGTTVRWMNSKDDDLYRCK